MANLAFGRSSGGQQYNQLMDRQAIEAFARRSWERTTASKRAFWAERFRRDWRSTWTASQLLLAHARVVRTEFPSTRDRDLDLAAHLSLRATLDRASHGITGR